jgi:hypothetical protein
MSSVAGEGVGDLLGHKISWFGFVGCG